jgi:hypothetical protein
MAAGIGDNNKHSHTSVPGVGVSPEVVAALAAFSFASNAMSWASSRWAVFSTSPGRNLISTAHETHNQGVSL